MGQRIETIENIIEERRIRLCKNPVKIAFLPNEEITRFKVMVTHNGNHQTTFLATRRSVKPMKYVLNATPLAIGIIYFSCNEVILQWLESALDFKLVDVSCR
jgi:hypothetical protein